MITRSNRWRLRCGVYGALGVILVLHGCNSLFYLPDRKEYSSRASYEHGCEDVAFSSLDGTQLHGWFLPAAPSASVTATRRPAKGTVIHFHGNAQNLSAHVGFVDWLPKLGFNVFIFDYRGYGQSAGSPSRQGIHEDCLAALAHVKTLPGVDPERVVVFAQSLGGACAVAALGEAGTQGVRGVAIDSSFANYIAMGNEVLGGTVLTYPLVWLLLSNAHRPDQVAARISPVPMLFFHSEHDPVVPHRQGRKLYDAAAEPKEFVTVWLEGHTTAVEVPECRQRLVRFFETCLGE